MTPSEMIQTWRPLNHSLPATPLSCPNLSSSNARLNSPMESPNLLPSAQSLTVEDTEELNSKLMEAKLPSSTGESQNADPVADELGDEEAHGSGGDATVSGLPELWRDGWELIWEAAIDVSPYFDTFRGTSSDEAFSDTSYDEDAFSDTFYGEDALSEASSGLASEKSLEAERSVVEQVGMTE